MDERISLQRIEHIERRVRAESRWYGFFCLILALAAFAYVVIVHLDGAGSRWVLLLFAMAFTELGVLWWRYGRNQLAVGHTQAHLDLPMGLATLVLMTVALIARSTLLPPGFSMWLVLVALLPAIPCLLGSWKVLRG